MALCGLLCVSAGGMAAGRMRATSAPLAQQAGLLGSRGTSIGLVTTLANRQLDSAAARDSHGRFVVAFCGILHACNEELYIGGEVCYL